jgi:hypothetical protein
MGIIGSEFSKFSQQGLLADAVEECPFVMQHWWKLPIFPLEGNPIQGVVVNIPVEKFGQPIGHCDELQDKTILPKQQLRTFPYGEYASKHVVTAVAADTLSSCRDPKAIETQLAIKEILYKVSSDFEVGNSAVTPGSINGVLAQCDPDKVKDLECTALTKEELFLTQSMVTTNEGVCGILVGNLVAELALLKAFWEEGINIDYTHVKVCCADNTIKCVQRPKFNGWLFVRNDLMTVNFCEIVNGDGGGGGGEAGKKKKKKTVQKMKAPPKLKNKKGEDVMIVEVNGGFIMTPVDIVQSMNAGQILSANLIMLMPGWNNSFFFTQANQGRSIFRVRETVRDGRSHIENQIYLPIGFAIRTNCACAVVKDFIPLPSVTEPGPIDGDVISATRVREVNP